MVRICKSCKLEKDISEFHIAGSYYYQGEKKKRYRGACKLCVNKKWRDRRNALLDEFITERKCKRCGYDKTVEALEFHHLDPNEKEFTIASRWTISRERLKEEIEKCVILCCLCHRELHAGIWNIDELGP